MTDPHTKAVVRIMDAIGESRRMRCLRSGVFLADPRHHAMRAIHTIGGVLGWRVETLEAKRTNLNDLEIARSPLGQMARAADKGRPMIMVLRGWHPDMAKDPRIGSMHFWFGLNGSFVILADSAEAPPADHAVRDLSDLG